MLTRVWNWSEKLLGLPGKISALPGAGFSSAYNEPLLTTILLNAALMRLPSLNAAELSMRNNRYVVCQLVLCSIPALLDIEPVLPGEGETVAAARLLRRMLDEQPRMVDVFTFDALYADANVLNILNIARKWWVVVLKQEAREAYEEIDRLLSLTTPSQHTLRGADVTLWDIPQMTCWDTLNSHFRAVVSEERKWKTRLNKERKKEKYLETTHWRWLTNLPEIYSAPTVHLFGHARWDIENRGFNELARDCHFDHSFRHHPNALLAMLLIISLAFNILYAFFERNLKPQLRAGIQTRAQLVVELLVSLPQAARAFPPGHT